MQWIKNDHWVYISWYYELEYKLGKLSMSVKVLEIEAWWINAISVMWWTSWIWMPLSDKNKLYDTVIDAIMDWFRQAYTFYKPLAKEKDKFLEWIANLGIKCKQEPSTFFEEHFVLRNEEQAQAVLDAVAKITEQPTEETKSSKWIDFSKHIKEKEIQFYAGDTIKCIDTWWLNSLFLWKEYQVERVNTVQVWKNTYEQVVIWGSYYQAKYFTLVAHA